MGLYMGGGRGYRRSRRSGAGSFDGYSDDGYDNSDADSERAISHQPRADHEKRTLWSMLLQETNIPQTAEFIAESILPVEGDGKTDLAAKIVVGMRKLHEVRAKEYFKYINFGGFVNICLKLSDPLKADENLRSLIDSKVPDQDARAIIEFVVDLSRNVSPRPIEGVKRTIASMGGEMDQQQSTAGGLKRER